MELRNLGKSTISVPVIGMGTWRTFHVSGTEAELARQNIVKAAFEAGANFFDSSPMYGPAERVLGKAIANLGIRDRVLIATKVWTSSDAESQRQYERAFEYFGGYVDLYQVHNLAAWEKRLDQLEAWRDQGKVRAVGVTHYSRTAFNDIAYIMETGRIDAIQIPYNALDREAERMLFPMAELLSIGTVIMRPFGEGSLLRNTPPTHELARFESFGVRTWPQILLKWIASDPRVSVIIPATSHAARMTENAVAGDPPWFDDETRQRVSHLAAQY